MTTDGPWIRYVVKSARSTMNLAFRARFSNRS